MKFACIGGGPAGLYLSILLKLLDKNCDVSVFERNAEGHTEGWGIVFWNNLVRQISDSDPVSAATILDNARTWGDQVLHFDGRTTTHRGRGGYSIGRKRFLEILTERARQLGVELHYMTDVRDLDRFETADVVVAADGAGSLIRDARADAFGTKIRRGQNKYIWLGSTKVLEAFTFSIVSTPAGRIWLHGYPHGSDMSTCVVECSPETWQGLGFDSLDVDAAVRRLEGIFADILGGQKLLHGGASWHNFRTVSNETWRQGHIVLAGDAAHTAHFSIGSGTALAMEDAIAMARQLRAHSDLGQALAAYERERKRALRQIQSDAHFSALWFETIERYLGLPDRDIFRLLLLRRSPLLARMPPRLYGRLHRSVESVPALKSIQGWIVPRARAAYSRWRS